MMDRRDFDAAALTIDHVVTHGRAGAVDGSLTFAGRAARFCDVFDFSNAKGSSVSRIISYRVDL